jgi:D-3-phosphoglycerate dehydrogenase / 2-oxoglutarate reductase
MFKILISDKLGQAGLDRLDEMPDVTYEMKTGLSQEELCEILPGYDALIIRSGTKATAEVLAAGPIWWWSGGPVLAWTTWTLPPPPGAALS